MSQQSDAAGVVEGAGAPGAAPGRVSVPIAKALEVAGNLYLSGRLPQAERICRQILERQPNQSDVLNLLGVVLNAKGDADEAVAMIGHAILINPKIASHYSNLGEVERQRGNLDEAQAALATALELDPQSAQAHSNLGIVHFDREEYEEAAAQYEKAIALQPDFPEAHNNLGNAYRALKRRTEALACYQRAVTQREDYPEAYNNMATSLRDAEDFDSAEHAYRKAIAQKPSYVEAYNNLSILLLHVDRTEEALRILSDALKLDEKNVTTLLNVAKTQLKRGAHKVSEQATRLAIEGDPENAEAHCVLGQIYHELDRHEEALGYIAQAIALEPEAAEYRSFHGVVLKSVGRLDEARAEIHKALELNPEHFGAYSNLNDLETFEADHVLLARMQDILATAENPETERYMPVHFAFAKALEDAGDYPLALHHYQTGARLRRGTLKYDEAETFRFFDLIKATFSAETFASRPWPGNPSPTPVYWEPQPA